MKPGAVFRAAARCWERASHFDRAAERYARADAWADAGRCWAEVGRFVDAANAYARAGEPIGEARQWLASPWPERARRPYRQALELKLSTAAKVEALLGLGEIDLASERAFPMASENGRSAEALRSLARIAAARGRPDMAARAWDQAITWSPTDAREIFNDWERTAPWNRSLGWRRPQAKAPGWPSRVVRDVRLEPVWKDESGKEMMYGNRGLAWSADGKRFAAAQFKNNLIIGELAGLEIKCRSVECDLLSVAFIPGSDSVLVGCDDGHILRVDAYGVVEDAEVLRRPSSIYDLAFSPQGNLLAVTTGGLQATLRIWSWNIQGPREILQEQKRECERANPSCVWYPDGRTLAWCPGPWSDETVPNHLYLLSDVGSRCVSAAHENGINALAVSPDGRYIATASLDRTCALRDARTGEALTSPRNCIPWLVTSVFHPHAALMAVGGATGNIDGFHRSGRFYFLRFSEHNPSHLEVLQENTTETGVCSLAFSPDGEYLLMSTRGCLFLFRVHLI